MDRKIINLLPKEYIEPKKYRTINRLSLGILGTYIFLVIALFGYFLFLSYQKNQLTKQNSSLIQEIDAQKNKEGLLVVLQNRINVAKSIFSLSSPSASELVNTVASLLPSSVELVSVSADRDGKVLLIVKSPSSQGIAEVISILEERKFTGVALNTLVLNNEQEYVLSLDIRP